VRREKERGGQSRSKEKIGWRKKQMGWGKEHYAGLDFT
jgi:hypothetical protein